MSIHKKYAIIISDYFSCTWSSERSYEQNVQKINYN